jgi:mycothiol synthase
MTTDMMSKIDTSATLPEGYSQRPTVMDDVEAVTRVLNAAIQARGEDEILQSDLIRRDWEDPKWNLSASSQVILNAQGEIIGTVRVEDVHNPTHPGIGCDATPGDHWDAVMRVMVAWAEQRALQALERCTPEERFAPATGCLADSADQALFESLGYKPIRSSFHMALTLQDAPTVIPLPAGFTIKTFDYPTEVESLVEAFDDMWQDHYGYVKRPLAERVDDWARFIDGNPKFDASMWYIATDNATGEIAGIVLCEPEAETKPDEGYIMIVGVRRAYRKRGLAQAMLTHAFAEYWRRGQKTVGLGVDASSLTGATRLYERVGMAVAKRYVRMEKEMRPGIERMNTGS